MEGRLGRNDEGFTLDGKVVLSHESIRRCFEAADYCEMLCKSGREHESSGFVETLLNAYLASLAPSSRHKFLQSLQKVINRIGNEAYNTYDEYIVEQRKLECGHD